MMAELKTRPTGQSVESFIASSCGEGREPDCRRLREIMAGVTGAESVMWGSSIVGFGSYHYRYASGREGDWFLVGFAPRKQDLTIYIMAGFEKYEELLARLGRFRTGKGCLYVKRLADVDEGVLEELIAASVAYLREQERTLEPQG